MNSKLTDIAEYRKKDYILKSLIRDNEDSRIKSLAILLHAMSFDIKEQNTLINMMVDVENYNKSCDIIGIPLGLRPYDKDLRENLALSYIGYLKPLNDGYKKEAAIIKKHKLEGLMGIYFEVSSLLYPSSDKEIKDDIAVIIDKYEDRKVLRSVYDDYKENSLLKMASMDITYRRFWGNLKLMFHTSKDRRKYLKNIKDEKTSWVLKHISKSIEKTR